MNLLQCRIKKNELFSQGQSITGKQILANKKLEQTQYNQYVSIKTTTLCELMDFENSFPDMERLHKTADVICFTGTIAKKKKNVKSKL